METTVTRRYHFEAGHWLPRVPSDHKCRRQHGHNYEIEVTVSGSVMWSGFVMDFAGLDHFVEPLIRKVDHRNLNDIPGLENPTAELIGEWFLEQLPGAITQIKVYETKDCWATVTRPRPTSTEIGETT